MWPGTGLLNDIASSTASTTSGLVTPVVVSLFNSFFNLLFTVLPYAVGILLFYVGYRMARRSLSGS